MWVDMGLSSTSVSHLDEKFPGFQIVQRFFPISQEPTNKQWPKHIKPNSHPYTSSKNHFNIISPSVITSAANGVLSRRQTGPTVTLTTHLHPAPRLTMSGAILLILLYALMAWTGEFCLLVYLSASERWGWKTSRPVSMRHPSIRLGKATIMRSGQIRTADFANGSRHNF